MSGLKLVKVFVLLAMFVFCFQISVAAAGLGEMLSGYVPGPDVDNGWSLFVGGDLEVKPGAANLEGRAFVRGDFINSSSSWYGINADNYAGSWVRPSPDVPYLVIGGNLRGTKYPDTTCGGVLLRGSDMIQQSDWWSGYFVDETLDLAPFDNQLAEATRRSQMLAGLPVTAGVVIEAKWGGLYITAAERSSTPQLWVIELDIDATPAFWGVSMDGFESGDTILVNCRKQNGDASFTLDCNSFGINGNYDVSPLAVNLLWNFPEAESIRIAGGTISVIGDGAVIQLDGSSGEYAFISTNQNSAVFTMVITPPKGYEVDPARPSMPGVFSPAGRASPVAMGSGLAVSGELMLEDSSAAANPYFLSFELTQGDPEVIYNNIPLVKRDSLSSDVAVNAYAARQGGAVLKLATIDESGRDDIVIEAWISGNWVEVGRVPASEVAGEGNNRYTIHAPLLQADHDYKLRILDEAGGEHFKFAYISVKSVRATRLRRSGEYMEMTFRSEYGSKYRVYQSSTLLGGDDNWTPCELFFPHSNGWSDLTDSAFYAGQGESTTVRIPADSGKAGFFKVVLIED